MAKRIQHASLSMNGGIFDWIRRTLKRAAPPVPGLPAPPERPLGLPAPGGGELIPAPPTPPKQPQLPSIFEAFAPPAIPPPPREAPMIFHVFPPTEVEPAEELIPWEAMFPIQEISEVPAAEMFAPFGAPPEAPLPIEEPMPATPITAQGLVPYEATDWAREFPDIVERTKGNMPKWVLWNFGWQPMPTMSLLATIRRDWDLAAIFDQVLDSVQSPWWRQTVEESAHTGEPAELELQVIGQMGNPYQDVARFFGVPDNLIEAYARDPEGSQLLWDEVLGPLMERFMKAMDILKPRGLRGWFEIWPSKEGDVWLKYREAKYRPQHA